MANRKLHLQKLLDGISPALRQEYFNRKAQDFGRPIDVPLTTDGIIAYLDSAGDQDIKDSIRQDLIYINDLCEGSMGILVEEVNKRGIQIEENESCEQLSMRMFLRNKEVFEFAHDRYYFTHCSGKISEHNISALSIELTEEKKNNFAQKVRAHYAKSAKGGNCIIRFHREGTLMIAVIHGSYKKAVSSWESDTMEDTKTLVYRPAQEDILEYKDQKLSSRRARQRTVRCTSPHLPLKLSVTWGRLSGRIVMTPTT